MDIINIVLFTPGNGLEDGFKFPADLMMSRVGIIHYTGDLM